MQPRSSTHVHTGMHTHSHTHTHVHTHDTMDTHAHTHTRLFFIRYSMFAVLAWTAVEMERVSELATLKPDALAAMHESPFVYLSSLLPQQVRK